MAIPRQLQTLPGAGIPIGGGPIGMPSSFAPGPQITPLPRTTGLSPVAAPAMAPATIPVEKTQPQFNTGDQFLDQALQQYKTMFDKLQANGQMINPNIEITPDKLQELHAKAASIIDPQYVQAAKVASDSFLRGLGYSADQLASNEKQLETQYGRQLRNIGESSAEKGFAQSGIRGREEQNLATDFQNQINDTRRTLNFNTTNAASEFAGKFGGAALTGLNAPGLSNTPQVAPGEQNFFRNSGTTPVYQLSNSLYNGLIGSNQFQQQADTRNLANTFEGSTRDQMALDQNRKLNL